MTFTEQLLERIDQLTEIGIALSSQQDHHGLLEKILESAMKLTEADGATLYLLSDDKLHFTIARNNSIEQGKAQDLTKLPPLPLHDEQGNPNFKAVAAYTALHGATINIPDIRREGGFDFSGTFAYDQVTGYHSQSFLTVPMRNHEHDIIGVLQLINAINPQTKAVEPFSATTQRLAESLASQAAVALTKHQLTEDLRRLLEKIIEVIADAIDEKSHYTGGHCHRVPMIALLLAEAINNHHEGPLADFHLSKRDLYELRIAALLHDCGKITTPVHVVDKGSKLETIFDRLELVAARYEILRRDIEIAQLKARLEAHDINPAPENELLREQTEIFKEELEFLRRSNSGSEFMPEADQRRVVEIAQRRWQDWHGNEQPLLNDNEVENLCINKGTLLDSEREIVNNHIVTTQHMLQALPFPKHLSNVAEIAGNHHERMDGKGYPNGLTGEQMSVQARLMGIADIFEALTAADRPYKKAMPMSVALNILGKLSLEGHIDPDLFHIFVEQRVFERYARKTHADNQYDEVDVSQIPGYKGR